jgi:penicillin-binding protein 2
MFQPSPPPTPKPDQAGDRTSLALRAATLAVVAASLFAILVLRLWALQVLHSDSYAAQATQNDVRTIRIPAPRGQILDREGRVLVGNEASIALQVNPADLPEGTDCSVVAHPGRCRVALQRFAERSSPPPCRAQPYQRRCRELARVARVLGLRRAEVWRRFAQGANANPGQPVTISQSVDKRRFSFIRERLDRFPGVQFQNVFQRFYPFGSLAANALGHVGRITAAELKQPHFAREALPNDAVVGQDGVEYTYDRFLRGQDGELQQRVDATGAPVGQPYLVHSPTPGLNLQLTIDARLQRVARDAVAYGIRVAHADGEYGAATGAMVAMNPDTGAIYALVSYPSFSPTIYIPPNRGLAAVSKDPTVPLVDKAIAGSYPPGSTFKPITASAAWRAGLLSPGQHLPCTGSFERPGDTSHTVFFNWDTSVSALIDLPTALEISCDTFFYRLGNAFYDTGTLAFQAGIRSFGFGQTPPIDIPGAARGLVPDPRWKETNPAFLPPTLTDAQSAIATTWNPGDDINMSIGQGYLLVSPLQLAVAYSAIANGGKLVTPHVALATRDAEGRAAGAGRLAFPRPRSLRLSPSLLQELRQGLFLASHSPSGTSSAVFAGFQPTVYGKTGTAEVPPKAPNAWYAAFAGEGQKKLLVVTMIANGGHGGVSAAPAALRVFQAFFHPHAPLAAKVGVDQSN